MTADVIVVGGGPAGASTAFQLARQGMRVTVLERSQFPRSKPCAECLSPQAARLLHDMDVLSDLETQGAWLRGMVVRSPAGTVAHGDYAASHGFRAYRDAGLSIRREILDAALMRRAEGAGAHLVERARVSDVARDARNRVIGVRVLRPSGGAEELHAPLVIGADGLRSVVARRLAVAHTAVWPRRISLVAHYRDVDGITEYGEMHVEADGFVGIADVGNGVTTVAAVFPAGRAKEISANRSGFLDAWIGSKPHLRSRFALARRDDVVAAVGPFASHARRAAAPGVMLVGDAADFFDPFTGEGIYAALRGGELAAAAAQQALGAATERDAKQALRAYDAVRRREFGGKWVVERLIGAGVALPPVVNRVARAMAARKELADLLVGVTGDFIPAQRVLRLGYLARLFLQPLPTTAPTPAWP